MLVHYFLYVLDYSHLTYQRTESYKCQLKKLDNSEWSEYFDKVSKTIGSKNVEIEIAGLSLGDQIEVTSMPLNGLTYDSKNDLLEVVTESVDHIIKHPKVIHTDYSADGLHSVEVIDADNNHQIIKFTEPVALPAPSL